MQQGTGEEAPHEQEDQPSRDEMERIAKAGWGQLATRYVEELYHELDHKPFDQAWLQRFASATLPNTRVVDIGCGPGHITSHLATLGLSMMGVDLAPEMVNIASSLHPNISFVEGNMRDLPCEDESCGGILAMYSLIHLIRADVPSTLAHFHRKMKPKSPLMLSVHAGEGRIESREVFGEKTHMLATLYQEDEMRRFVEGAGFVVQELVVREAYPEEYPSKRVYLFAMRK